MPCLRHKDVQNRESITLIVGSATNIGWISTTDVQPFSITRDYETLQTPFPAINQLVTKDSTFPELELH